MKIPKNQETGLVKDLALGAMIVVSLTLIACLVLFSNNLKDENIRYIEQLQVRQAMSMINENLVKGSVSFSQSKSGVRVVAELGGFEPGQEHSFVILKTMPTDSYIWHDVIFGAGPQTTHGCPLNSSNWQTGDLGNFIANTTGYISADYTIPKLSVHELLGRMFGIAQDRDTCKPDFYSQILTAAPIGVYGFTGSKDQVMSQLQVAGLVEVVVLLFPLLFVCWRSIV